MPLTTGEFIVPRGNLSAEMFPGADLTAYLTVWIADAAVEAPGNEEAQRAYVRCRASQVAGVLGGQKLKFKIGDTSVETGGDAGFQFSDDPCAEYKRLLGLDFGLTPILTAWTVK